jgi:Transposase
VYQNGRLVEDTAGWLTIEGTIQPRENGRPICSGCQQARPGYDRLPPRRFEFVPLWAIPVIFVYAMRSQVAPLQKLVRTLRKHQDLLLIWFRAEETISSGTVEGFNHKAKLTIRKSYGFRTEEGRKIPPVSRTRRTSRTGIHPRILLRRRKFYP